MRVPRKKRPVRISIRDTLIYDYGGYEGSRGDSSPDTQLSPDSPGVRAHARGRLTYRARSRDRTSLNARRSCRRAPRVGVHHSGDSPPLFLFPKVTSSLRSQLRSVIGGIFALEFRKYARMRAYARCRLSVAICW